MENIGTNFSLFNGIPIWPCGSACLYDPVLLVNKANTKFVVKLCFTPKAKEESLFENIQSYLMQLVVKFLMNFCISMTAEINDNVGRVKSVNPWGCSCSQYPVTLAAATPGHPRTQREGEGGASRTQRPSNCQWHIIWRMGEPKTWK